MSVGTNVTVLLRQLRSGDADTRNLLAEVIYPELRRIAGRHFKAERRDHLLQPTALVHEAFLRLAANDRQTWENRAHFFGAAAASMRRILIDQARARRAEKRGGDEPAHDPGPALAVEAAPSIDLLELDLALTGLAARSPRQARIVELRYFGGLTVPETAEALGINARTVDRDWATARAWLRRRLRP
jgi:RNA polymerase sigma factor (TIGR02999 family)